MGNLNFDDDKILVARLKGGEVQAFDVLFHKYSNKLYRFSFSLLKNEEDSGEIVQETFLRIWKKHQSIDSGKSFRSYLFTISYNLIIDLLRLRLKDQEYRKFLATFFEPSQTEKESQMDYESLDKKIREAIDLLPDKRKQIYKLSREEGLNHKEIAEKLNLSVKTVENQINLSLKQIKTHLGGDLVAILLFISLFA